MKKLSQSKQDELEKMLLKYSGILMKYKGVVDVGVGYLMKDNKITDEIGLIAYVKEKHSEKNLDKEDILPKYIEGYRVDVIEKKPVKQQSAYDRFDQLIGGISIYNSVIGGGGGTLACIVYDKDTNQPLGLSNWHILKRARGARGNSVTQPRGKKATPEFKVGTLDRWNKNLDCAAFLVNGREINTASSLYNVNGKIQGIMKAVPGMKVKKAGTRTGLTYGIILSVNVNDIVIVPNPDKPAPNNEISMGGDSGSLWVTDATDLYAVALHHSGDKEGTPNAEFAYAHDIDKVANILNFRF